LSEVPAWALAHVPGLSGGQPALRTARLGGGTVNNVFRVISKEGDFALRLDGPAWRRPGVDRARELIVHRIAAHGGIAPSIVVAAPESQGLLITEYQPGRTWSADNYVDVAALRRLGERLYALHRLPAPDIEVFDPFQVGQAYASQIAHRDASLEVGMRRLELLCRGLRNSDATPAIVHGDLWQGNLQEGSRLWLLDWEYAQLTDPLMDIACVLAYYPEAERYRDELLAAAGLAAAGLAATGQARNLDDRVDIYRLLSWLWHLARGEAAQYP